MKKQSSAWAKAHISELRKRFGNLPIVDSTEDLLVIPNSMDIAKAVPGDPANCAMSQSCKRLYGSIAVVFFRDRAYIDLPNEKGEREIRRFMNSPALKQAILQFDKTGVFPLSGFRLKRVPKAQSFKHKARLMREYAKKIAAGHVPRRVAANKKATATKKAWALEGVRSGQGLSYVVRKARA